MPIFRLLPVLALLTTLAAPLKAAPVDFVFDGLFSSAPPAILPSPNPVPFVLTVRMDNGGASLQGQSWTAADFVSADLVSGSYSASFADATSAQFQTGAAGQLQNPVQFSSTDPGFANVDTAGGAQAPVLFLNGVLRTSLGGTVNSAGNSSTTTLSRWTLVPVAPTVPPIPAPAGAILLLSALGAGAAAARRGRRPA